MLKSSSKRFVQFALCVLGAGLALYDAPTLRMLIGVALLLGILLYFVIETGSDFFRHANKEKKAQRALLFLGVLLVSLLILFWARGYDCTPKLDRPATHLFGSCVLLEGCKTPWYYQDGCATLSDIRVALSDAGKISAFETQCSQLCTNNQTTFCDRNPSMEVSCKEFFPCQTATC